MATVEILGAECRAGGAVNEDVYKRQIRSRSVETADNRVAVIRPTRWVRRPDIRCLHR